MNVCDMCIYIYIYIYICAYIIYVHTCMYIYLNIYRNTQTGPLISCCPQAARTRKTISMISHPHTVAQTIVDIQIYTYIQTYIYTIYTSVLNKCRHIITIVRFRVSELFPNIWDMQSGAKCCSASISDIHCGLNCVDRHGLGQVFCHGWDVFSL